MHNPMNSISSGYESREKGWRYHGTNEYSVVVGEHGSYFTHSFGIHSRHIAATTQFRLITTIIAPVLKSRRVINLGYNKVVFERYGNLVQEFIAR